MATQSDDPSGEDSLVFEEPAMPREAEALLGRVAVQAVMLRAATIDIALGCYTSVYFAQRAREEIERRQRYGERLSVLLIAPDAQDGKAPDDASLRRVVDATKPALRSTDLIGRWDADELAILLPSTGLAGATRLARRIVERLQEGTNTGPTPTTLTPVAPVPVSIGIATWLGPAEALGTLLERARGGLADARARGGGTVAIS